jgi:hypothetical protein
LLPGFEACFGRRAVTEPGLEAGEEDKKARPVARSRGA